MCETTGKTLSIIIFILANAFRFLALIMDFSEVWYWRTSLQVMKMNEPESVFEVKCRNFGRWLETCCTKGCDSVLAVGLTSCLVSFS